MKQTIVGRTPARAGQRVSQQRSLISRKLLGAPRITRLGAYMLLICLTTTPALTQTSAVREIERQFPSVAAQLRGGSDFVTARETAAGIPMSGLRAKARAASLDGARALPQSSHPAEQAALRALAARSDAAVDGAAAGLQLFYPQFYDQPFVAQLGGQRVVLRALAARSGASAETNDPGSVAYRDVYDNVDSVHVATGGRSEEFLLLHSKAAPLVYEYEIVEMQGVSRVELRNGAVHFLRAGTGDAPASGFGRAPELMIERPWLVDARGERSETKIHWELLADGSKLRLIVDAEGLTYPLLVDPTFAATGSMISGRSEHTATLLPNGKVLVAGGFTGGILSSGSATNTAELYDPASGTFTATGSMSSARSSHSATLLRNGKVLMAGGGTAELYDPASGTFAATGSMSSPRGNHTATLLPNGKVLVAGGNTFYDVFTDSYPPTNTAELYDPASGTFAATGSMSIRRESHTATLLPNGKVLVAGGIGDYSSSLQSYLPTNTADLYDPVSGTFAATGSMSSPRDSHTATLLPNGKVLVAWGSTAELYDPASGTFAVTGSMSIERENHTATLLPNGKVLVAGGYTGQGESYLTNTADLYDPASGTFAATGSMSVERQMHTATLLPNGKVLVAGGEEYTYEVNSADLYDPASGSFAATGSMSHAREYHTATLLPNGKVLVAGGFTGSGSTSTAELYDPASGTFAATGSMISARTSHTATLLANGKVLVAGGDTETGYTYTNTAELYDPASGTFAATGSMSSARESHTATLLQNGKVLVAGGDTTAFGDTNTAELYDPASGTFVATGSMSSARVAHTATLLPNGKVLVAGGETGSGSTSTPELYDPALGTFTATGSMSSARSFHTATLLPNGKVLVAGGDTGSHPTSTAELYDPASGTFAATGSMSSARDSHTATLLPNGKALVASDSSTNTAELYDPVSGTFAPTGSLSIARYGHTATLLPNGKVMVVGGPTVFSGSSTAELYDSGLGFAAARRPVLSTVTTPLVQPAAISITGTNLTGDSEASGGSANNSASNNPVLHLQRVDNDQTATVLLTAWSATHLQSVALSGMPRGHYRVTVFVNGIPSEQKIIEVDALTSAPVLTTIGNKTVAENAALSFTVSASDANGDLLTYSATGLPAGATFCSSRVFSWTPTYSQSGSYDVTFSVSDGNGGTDSEQITITITNVNRAPELASIGAKSVAENSPLTFTISATDADSEPLTYSATNLPTGASFDPATRTFAWTPGLDQAGTRDVTFTVTDVNSGTDSELVTITVTNTNQAPVLGAIGDKSVAENATLSFMIAATDGDSDALTYSATGLPAGATLNSGTGAFSWTPGPGQSGTYDVTFSVSDGNGATDSEMITITVYNHNLAPQAPTGVVATAVTTTSVSLTWNASPGATSYVIFRRSAGVPFTQIATASVTSYNDTSVTSEKAYLYRIRAANSGGSSPDSAQDIATTVLFTNDPLVAQSTLVQAVHLTQQRTAINAVRQLGGLSNFVFTDPTPAGLPIRSTHVLEMRTALDQARSALVMTTGGYTDGTLAGIGVKAAHFQEIRNRMR